MQPITEKENKTKPICRQQNKEAADESTDRNAVVLIYAVCTIR